MHEHCTCTLKVGLHVELYRVSLKSGHIRKITYSIRLSACFFDIKAQLVIKTNEKWRQGDGQFTPRCTAEGGTRRQQTNGPKLAHAWWRWEANCLCDIVRIHFLTYELIGQSIKLQTLIFRHWVLHWNVALIWTTKFNTRFLGWIRISNVDTL